MDEQESRVACQSCGAMILPSTAERYGKRCAKCGGARFKRRIRSWINWKSLALIAYAFGLAWIANIALDARVAAEPDAQDAWLVFLIVPPIVALLVLLRGALGLWQVQAAAAIVLIVLSFQIGFARSLISIATPFIVALLPELVLRLSDKRRTDQDQPN